MRILWSYGRRGFGFLSTVYHRKLGQSRGISTVAKKNAQKMRKRQLTAATTMLLFLGDSGAERGIL